LKVKPLPPWQQSSILILPLDWWVGGVEARRALSRLKGGSSQTV